MIAVCLIPVYLLLCIYILRWILRWIGACSHPLKKKWVRVIIIIVYFFFATALGVGFLLPSGHLRRFMNHVGNYWLGTLIYITLIIVIADIIRIILRHIKRINQHKLRSRKTFVISGAICLVVALVLSVWGAVNARLVRTTNYEVTIDKDGGQLDSLKIVLAADLHMGYNIGCAQMQRMVDEINKADADLVVIAGDIFDNDYGALEDPQQLIKILKGIQSKYGVYACYGNHDIQEKILAGFTFSGKDKEKVSDPKMDELLEAANIKLLKDEGLLIEDSFYLYGRPDKERPNRGIDVRKTAEEITADMDKSKPIIIIDHEPRELDELAAAGVDLDLCGHTHDGQMFPGNLAIKLMWDNAYGYLKVGEMHNIVTSGVGLFGPNMRVGTKAEICPITVNFN